MPQTTLYDRTGATVGSVDLAETLFAAPVNEAVLHQAVVAQLAGRRLGTSDTRTRGEVRGGLLRRRGSLLGAVGGVVPTAGGQPEGGAGEDEQDGTHGRISSVKGLGQPK